MSETCDRRECANVAVWDAVITVDAIEWGRYLCGTHYDETARVLRDLGVPIVSRVR